jgi:hypothetical protein
MYQASTSLKKIFDKDWYGNLKSTASVKRRKGEVNVFIFRVKFIVGDQVDGPTCLICKDKRPMEITCHLLVLLLSGQYPGIKPKAYLPNQLTVTLRMPIGHIRYSRHKLKQISEL